MSELVMSRAAVCEDRAERQVSSDAIIPLAYRIRPTSGTSQKLLSNVGVQVTSEARSASPTEKLSLLKRIERSFYPTKLESALHCDFHDVIRMTWENNEPASPAAIAKYQAFADAIQDASPVRMPLAKHRGSGFILRSVIGSGAARYVERSVQALGPSLRNLDSEEPSEIPYWPAMMVSWPSCGTEERFYANFLSIFDGSLPRGSYFKTGFHRAAKRALRPIYVMALASIANIGILFVTGVTSANFDFVKSHSVLSFLDEFMGQTGTSVVFCCTAPVYEQISAMGPLFTAMTSGGEEEICWLDPSSEFYSEINLNLYNQSLMWEPVDAVPESILQAAVESTHGSREALNTFYRLLHTAAVRQNKEEPDDKFLDDVVKDMVRQTTPCQRVAAFLDEFNQSEKRSDAKFPKGAQWSDYLSLESYRMLGVDE
ncbi:hypothetical protein AB4Y45_23135 [Paraburkholderia sp. EG287A]|uniref:hypothetical protein n=1 Tax=Paraburkholderia sp. EG287A TaxID=3237012 RepID=UPI0034D21EBD